MKWPFKDPDEILDYSVDWSRFLGDEIINSVQWYVYDGDGVKTAIAATETVNGLTLGSQTNTNTVATVRWDNGTVNTTYRIVCAITYDTVLVSERTIQLPIRNR